MGKKKRKNSNYKNAPATSSVVEKKETRKSAFLSLIVAAIAIIVCVFVAVAASTDEDTVYVKMKVADYGTIVLKLDREAAPETVDNFVSLVNEGFYDGLTFHRVMSNFMIQGGCPNGDGTGDAGKTIKGEFASNGYNNPINHKRGVISMARGNAKDSASCQFFICNADAPHLNGDYAAFGKVIMGMNVVDDITSSTVIYANSNGAISNKSRQAVIEYVKVIGGNGAKSE